MKILLKRIHFDPDYTIGELYIDGVKHCYTLEDSVREKPGVPVELWKIPGKTAIPVGTYPVQVTYSPKFKWPLPLLVGVSGFSGVRIHPGNQSSESDGCILVGMEWDGGDWIGKSRAAFTSLFDKIKKSNEVTLEIQ